MKLYIKSHGFPLTHCVLLCKRSPSDSIARVCRIRYLLCCTSNYLGGQMHPSDQGIAAVKVILPGGKGARL